MTIPAADEASLSDDERVRAASYRSRYRADAFVATRTALRCVLAAYLELAPGAVPIMAERHRKPFLGATHGQPAAVRFNMAHRLDRILIAISRAEVGVDLEFDRSTHEVRAVERTVLSGSERSALTRMPDEDRHAAVLRQWVRREAVVKATGAGLRIPPATVDVGDPGESAVGRRVAAGGATWMLWDLCPWPDALAAVATEPAVTKIRRFESTPEET